MLSIGPNSVLIPGRMRISSALLLFLLILTSGCLGPRPGARLDRRGDEIVVCGQLFHTGTPVVLWTDPGGYDAYRVERRFSSWTNADWATSQSQVKALETPNRYGLRRRVLSSQEIEQVRGGGWDLPLLQRVVDQFVIHYDASGTSRRCFETLHDRRGLSVHFMLDIDGTLYQTLDLKERAWHATIANDRSIGIEIAQAGAFPVNQTNRLADWYGTDSKGTYLKIPERPQPSGIRTAGFHGRPARPEPIEGEIHGQRLIQYDFTPEQYASLAKLTAALCRVFPKLRCDYPRDAHGELIAGKLDDEQWQNYSGLLGHYHVQRDKVDPGPAFQWDTLIRQARRERLGCSCSPRKTKPFQAHIRRSR